MAFSGALLKKSADLTAHNFASELLTWDTEVYDVGGWHSASDSKVTVPSGVDYVQLYAGQYLQLASQYVESYFKKNGSLTVPLYITSQVNDSDSNNETTVLRSGVIPVVAGDYFENVLYSVDASASLIATHSYFAIRAIPTIRPTFSGCLSKPASDTGTVNLTTPLLVTLDAEVYDVGGWHSDVTNPSRMTVPSGVNYVQMTGQTYLTSLGDTSIMQSFIYKNGSAPTPLPSRYCAVGNRLNTNDGIVQVTTPPFAVSAGDYFELGVFSSDTTCVVKASGTWLSIEAVG